MCIYFVRCTADRRRQGGGRREAGNLVRARPPLGAATNLRRPCNYSKRRTAGVVAEFYMQWPVPAKGLLSCRR